MDEITQALFVASRQGNVPVLKEIFALKDDLDVVDEKGFTPLIIAAYNNQPEATYIPNAGSLHGQLEHHASLLSLQHPYSLM